MNTVDESEKNNLSGKCYDLMHSSCSLKVIMFTMTSEKC